MASTPTQTPLRVSNPNGNKLSDTYIWRPMRLIDPIFLAQSQAKAYWRSPVNTFIAPHAPEYPHHLTRRMREGITRRLLKDNTVSTVACLAEIPEVVVGYAQFSRLNAPQKKDMEVNNSGWGKWSRWALSWFFWAIFWIHARWDPVRAVSEENMRLFEAWGAEDIAKEWGPQHPERQNRWDVGVLLIDPAYQGKGLGKLLMQEPMARAQRDGVRIGLIASPHGSYLYRHLGFEKLADFSHPIDGELEGADGGLYMWTPKDLKVGDKKTN